MRCALVKRTGFLTGFIIQHFLKSVEIWFVNYTASTNRWKFKSIKFNWAICRYWEQIFIWIKLLTFCCIWKQSWLPTIKTRCFCIFICCMRTCVGRNNLFILVSIDNILPFSRKVFSFDGKLVFFYLATKWFKVFNVRILRQI